MKLGIIASAVLCALALAAAVSGPVAQTGDSQQRNPMYTPGLSDMMTLTQLRHLKLGFAGKVENWDLASYEVGELRKTFDVAARSYSAYHGLPLADMIEKTSKPALADIERSIEAKDMASFGKSFEQLTRECNACHQAAKVPFIVIRVPTASPFSNQVFSTGGKAAR